MRKLITLSLACVTAGLLSVASAYAQCPYAAQSASSPAGGADVTQTAAQNTNVASGGNQMVQATPQMQNTQFLPGMAKAPN